MTRMPASFFLQRLQFPSNILVLVRSELIGNSDIGPNSSSPRQQLALRKMLYHT